MICTFCNDDVPLPKPTSAGQRLARKCHRHYVDVGFDVLVIHDGAVQRAQVSAVHGLTFSYRLADGAVVPGRVGARQYRDEGVWWTLDMSTEAAAALAAAWKLHT